MGDVTDIHTREPFDPSAQADTAEKLAHVAERNRILAMARRGATPSQISEVLAKGDSARGIAPVHLEPSEVQQKIKAYLESARREDALSVEQLRVLENERLDALQSALETELRFVGEGGEQHLNLKVADRIIRLSERRAKMNGLDAPQVMEHRVGEGLAELGILTEHLRSAEEAFETTFAQLEMPDVEVVDEPVSP